MLAEGERSLVKDGGTPAAVGPYAATQQDEPIEQEADDEMTRHTIRRPISKPSSAAPAGGAYGGTSYPPNELYGYETVLNQNGTWMSDPSYGYVWYPRVQSDWRPSSIAAGGITCRATAGRGSAPNGGRGRRIITGGGDSIRRAASSGFRRGDGARRGSRGRLRPTTSAGARSAGMDARSSAFASFGTTAVVARGYDPWRGWTVVNSNRFGRGYDVRRNRVDHRVIDRERPAFVTAWGPPRRAGLGGDVIVRGSARDGRGVPAPERHGYADPRNVYGSRLRGGGGSRSGSRIGDPGVIAPRDNNAEPEESPYDRAMRVMNRRAATIATTAIGTMATAAACVRAMDRRIPATARPAAAATRRRR